MRNSRPAAPRGARWTALGVIAALYVPLLSVVVGSLFTRAEGWTVRWYGQVFDDPALGEALANSLMVAAVSALVATLLGAGAAIGLRVGSAWGRRVLRGLSSIALLMPEIIFALSLLAWFSVLRWTLGFGSLVAAHVTFSMSYALLTVAARLETLDPALEDAARDLGASEGQVLWYVTLPLLVPALLASFALCFLLSFDDFLITFFVSGAGSTTLPMKLYSIIKTGLSPKVHALATLMWLVTGVIMVLGFRSRGLRAILRGATEEKRYESST